ncbi:hypothetical protein DH2020_048961 [Rehmannia glutinosa]|uniref:BSD domain-containing protein n=1 Tax=Rehmannia glutinosa TaxID=99300 RepID=A0ABR0U481_REHGL
MDFFKSVFSDPTPTASPDPSPPSTPTASPNPSPPSTAADPNPDSTLPPTSSWAFGSTLFKTIASKSESLLDNYYKDLQDFSTGLKKETSVIRQAASRAVQDLPARLESGAAIAQESLEAVGQAIDNVGSTVSEIIGKDLNFASSDGFLNTRLDERDDDKDLNFSGNPKPYSRIDAMIREVQCNIRTYCDEVEESGYNEWKLGVGKVVKAEEARARIVKKAILGEEEEELSWDFDDDDENDNNGEYKSKDEMKKDAMEKGKEEEKRDNEDVGVSGTKSDDVVVDEENLGERLIYNEKEVSDGKIGSDISVISSQRSSHAEDDLGWDEIEDIGSGDESKVSHHGSPSPSNVIDLQKRLSSAGEEEELTWDIEDDDDEPVKL